MRHFQTVVLCVCVASIIHNSSLFAQPDNHNKPLEAAVVISQFEKAIANIKQQFGQTVLSDRRAEVESAQNGRETIGEAWNRHLISAGFPESYSERENVARGLDLSPPSALILMGAADEAKINHLLDELRRIGTK